MNCPLPSPDGMVLRRVLTWMWDRELVERTFLRRARPLDFCDGPYAVFVTIGSEIIEEVLPMESFRRSFGAR